MAQNAKKSKQANAGGWLRLYTDILDDSKAQRLPSHLFKSWINCLALTKLHDGRLPPLDEIAFRLRLSAHDAQTAIDELILVGLIDIGPDGTLSPHGWSNRQYAWDGKDRTAAKRMKRMRYGRVTDDVTVGVTVGVTDDVTVPASVSDSVSIQVEGLLVEGNSRGTATVTTDEVPL